MYKFFFWRREKTIKWKPNRKTTALPTKAHTLFHHLLLLVREEIDLLLLGFHPLEELTRKSVALVTWSNAPLFARHGWLELDGRLDGSIPRLEETITHTPLKKEEAAAATATLYNIGSNYRWKSFWTRSAIILAMAKEDVAPGEGALRQWRILGPSSPTPESKTKSSTRLPWTSRAWARTPAGPLSWNGQVRK